MLTENEINYLQSLNIEELNECFIIAIKEQYLEAINFMLTSNLLKENVDIHLNNDYPFKILCHNYYSDEGNLDLIKYFIFEYHIKKNKRIDKCIKYNEGIQDLFLIRDRMQYLENELILSQESIKPKL